MTDIIIFNHLHQVNQEMCLICSADANDINSDDVAHDADADAVTLESVFPEIYTRQSASTSVGCSFLHSIAPDSQIVTRWRQMQSNLCSAVICFLLPPSRDPPQVWIFHLLSSTGNQSRLCVDRIPTG